MQECSSRLNLFPIPRRDPHNHVHDNTTKRFLDIEQQAVLKEMEQAGKNRVRNAYDNNTVADDSHLKEGNESPEKRHKRKRIAMSE